MMSVFYVCHLSDEIKFRRDMVKVLWIRESRYFYESSLVLFLSLLLILAFIDCSKIKLVK